MDEKIDNSNSFSELNGPVWPCGEVLTCGWINKSLTEIDKKENKNGTIYIPKDIFGLVCRFVGPFLLSYSSTNIHCALPMKQINQFIGQNLNYFCNSKEKSKIIEWQPILASQASSLKHNDNDIVNVNGYNSSNILNSETVAISTVTTMSVKPENDKSDKNNENDNKNEITMESLVSLKLRSEWMDLTMLDHRILRDILIFVMNNDKLQSNIRLKNLEIETIATTFGDFKKQDKNKNKKNKNEKNISKEKEKAFGLSGIMWLYPILCHSTWLERIVLSNNKLDDKCVELICQALYYNNKDRKYNKLGWIDLSDNKEITDECVIKYFIPMILNSFDNLRGFNFNATGISDKTLDALTQFWKQKDERDNKLCFVKLNENAAMTQDGKTKFEQNMSKLFDQNDLQFVV